jgi:hypothetical protein
VHATAGDDADLPVHEVLSRETGKARQAGAFPAHVDRTRRIDRPQTIDDPDDARKWLREQYRIDRTDGQPIQLVLGVEKDTVGGSR